MPKRAERRHHEERIKEKFRRVAKRFAGRVSDWTHKWKVKWEGGKIIAREQYLDWTGGVKRMRYIEDAANRMAHHNKCDCNMCKRERYRDHRHKEKMLDKNYIEEGKDTE